MRFIEYHEQCQQQWEQAITEAQKLQLEVESGHKTIQMLENKLRHARFLLDNEKKLRTQTQKEKEVLVWDIYISLTIFIRW